jgi:xanthine dehydrogenase accessory factor
MSLDLVQESYRLNQAGESFAIATVVRVERPISAKPGDKAIVRIDGTLQGWIGGGCAQDTVVREAKKAIRAGQPRLLRLRGRGATSEENPEGYLELPITCHSGGTLDIYVEPVLPTPQVILLGNSPVAVTLAKLVKAMDWRVDVVDPAATSEQFPEADTLSNSTEFALPGIHPIAFIVVATQGHDDERALLSAALSGVGYVAFVASKRKLASRDEYLREHGLSEDQVTRLKAPAGLDIGAITPDEIAASILAEMIQVRRQHWMPMAVEASSAIAAVESLIGDEARDPVCGMTVEVAGARYSSEFDGNRYYFCCAACQEQFNAHPASFRQETESNATKD